MITQAQIPAVLDHPVYDTTGDKIGEAKHVFVDDVTGRPDWVSVKTGFFGAGESFVPIHEATVVEDHLEVPYPKGKVKEAPNVDVDAGGHLSAAEERRLYDYYGIRWDAARGQAGRPGGGDGDGGRARRPAGGRTGDDAMTRSEEQMHVGVEQREAGKARLRKYVVTEEVQQTIPLRHEEVTLEREPVTEANRDAALSGPEISEAEHEVTLHAEEPVVETRTTPVERVRLETEEVTDQETVRGQVRKERIEADLPDKETGTDR
ncbi:PRC and DUF2382 domain-containing protein [Streptomyces sp. CB03238]|uniref:DUF2382 domain-containing protein n=1 Tax=Streptomyces sp. CB03238 TaxID=1907777 RepID=UPI000A107D23|nr:PRC and DUF2382 domain-containing protein [Streptomyces sp. CB03238]ORT56371.1 photosystem reaction center subunit H [Streptomyces sp. CB03238]